MPTRAQLSQERSRQRREELLAAAIELFAEGGSRAVTHRAVAHRAGLPPATTTYYFASIDDLLREALREHIVRWRGAVDDLAGFETTFRPVRSADVESVVAAVFAARGPEVAALELAIYLAATRDDELRAEAAEALRGFEALATRWLSRLGVPDPEPLAASLVAHVAGIALRRQSGMYEEADEAGRMARDLTSLAAAHLIGLEELDERLASLAASAD